MALYILKMDNPQHPQDRGEPTRVRLIGPFETKQARYEWANDPANNPYDNPCWQCVNLDTTVVAVVVP